MNPSVYIKKILDIKDSKIRTDSLEIGEFLFDFNGDMVGYYMGGNYVELFSKEDKENRERGLHLGKKED